MRDHPDEARAISRAREMLGTGVEETLHVRLTLSVRVVLIVLWLAVVSCAVWGFVASLTE